jgi:hypothetical protein
LAGKRQMVRPIAAIQIEESQCTQNGTHLATANPEAHGNKMSFG